jgi:hypothetical protein
VEAELLEVSMLIKVSDAGLKLIVVLPAGNVMVVVADLLAETLPAASLAHA